MDEPYLPQRRTWPQKFAAAFRGWLLGTRGHSSFAVHLPAAIAVAGAAAYLRVTAGEWCLLILCITTVIAAELFNSALEALAKAITTSKNEHVGRALDI